MTHGAKRPFSRQEVSTISDQSDIGSTMQFDPVAPGRLNRRRLLVSAGALPVAAMFSGFPALLASQRRVPAIDGAASGDVSADRAVVWSRTDRPSRLWVEYATTPSFVNPVILRGSDALAESDYTARAELLSLPPGEHIFYRVRFEDLRQSGSFSATLDGHFRTASLDRQDLHILWSADTAGQGFGINPEWGGYRSYDALRRENPDLFVHCGDSIYADGPFAAQKVLPDGTVWRNITTEATAKVAETIEEFRAHYRYHWMDEPFRRFHREVPVIMQWDDHETLNNWYPSKILPAEDIRYVEKRVSVLAARARHAFLEHTPILRDPADPGRIHRVIHYGPLLDIFVVDLRSFRGPNHARMDDLTPGMHHYLGFSQLAWLRRSLYRSRALWKVIASDLPIGLIVPDGDAGFETAANGNGPPRGRERELAGLLQFMRQQHIHNVVWLTGDVHYTAAHHYAPDRAVFTDFIPFWEFVSGPLHAITGHPKALDNTFGPAVRYQKAAPPDGPALAPSSGLQFYGSVRISGQTGEMTVTLKDMAGQSLYTVTLAPAAPA